MAPALLPPLPAGGGTAGGKGVAAATAGGVGGGTGTGQGPSPYLKGVVSLLPTVAKPPQRPELLVALKLVRLDKLHSNLVFRAFR